MKTKLKLLVLGMASVFAQSAFPATMTWYSNFVGSGLWQNGPWLSSNGFIYYSPPTKDDAVIVGTIDNAPGSFVFIDVSTQNSFVDGIARANSLTLDSTTAALVALRQDGSTLVTASEIIGSAGKASYLQLAGNHTVTNSMVLGSSSGGNGQYYLSSGNLTTNNIQVGGGGTGTFSQSGGSHSITNNLAFGTSGGGSGNFYALSGGSLSVGGSITTGPGGGSFYLDGGTLSVTGNTIDLSNFIVGNRAGSNGSFTLTAGKTLNSGTTIVGNLGSGTLNIQNGSKVKATSMSIGGHGVVNLNGGTLSVASASSASGAQFNWTSGTLNYTDNASLGSSLGLDNFHVLTTGKTLQVDKTLTVGAGQALILGGGSLKSGTLALAGGAVFAPGGINLSDAGNLSGYGTVSGAVSGGTGKSITASGGALTLGNANVNGGFNFAGNLNTGSNQVILLSGDKAQLGVSTTLGNGGLLSAVNGANLSSGQSLSYGGNASIDGNFTNNGQVSGAGGALTFLDDVNGAGSYAGNIIFKGAYNPGNSPALVSFNGGNATYGSTSLLTMEILGTNPGTQYDRLVNIGTLTFGGKLVLTTGTNFAGQAGQTFDLFDWNNATGTFASIDSSSFLLAANTRLDTSKLYVDGTISVAAVPEPETYAMFLVGLGLMGALARRRKQK